MKITISSIAEQQLQQGYEFYQHQANGLGDYFLDSLMSDIDSLLIHAGVHRLFFNKYHRLLSSGSPTRFITANRTRSFQS